MQSDSSAPSPFKEEIVLENYYASESSKQVLQAINQAVADGVRLMILTGEEGTGKTMLCNKLDHDPQDVFTTVYFARTVDSFEDVLRVVALKMGLEPLQGKEGRNVDSLLDEISGAMVQNGIQLFLIFDEAENIYLATLERIRKMLDRLSADGGKIHVLFSGRKTFLENSQQLSMCDFDNDEEYEITLEPLSKEETVAYLQYCSEKLADVDGSAIFTPEVINNISELSGGNFRMINILAEEATQKNGDDTSFMVLLENVKEDIGDGSNSPGFSQLLKGYVEQYRSYIPYGVALLAVIVIGSFILPSNEDEPGEERDMPVVVETIEEPAIIKIEPAEPADSEPVKIPNVTVEEDTPQLVQTDEQFPVAEETLEPQPPVEEQLPEVEIEVAEQTKFSASVIEEALEKPEPQQESPAKEVTLEETTKEEEPPSVAESPIEPAPIEVVTLHRDGTMKRRPGKLPKTTQVTIKEESKKEKSRNEVREVIASNAHFTVEQLYKKRLMAGTPWYRNERNDKYTVQLMVLTSEEAEDNLKKMLREDRYRQEAGNFYIFKKLSTSDTLFVFYGEYSTIAQARLAQNSLPRFLRAHKPYAISVKGAMAKVRR